MRPVAGVFVATCAIIAGLLVSGVARTSATPAGARSAAAFADAQLAVLTLPAGAVQVTTDESSGGVLTEGTHPVADGLIDAHRFYTIPGTVATVIAQVEASPPHGYSVTMTGSNGSQHGTSMTVVFGATHPPADIDEAQIDVTAAAGPAGSVAIRVDSFAVPLTPRPAWEHVPAAARVVTIGTITPEGTDARTLATIRSRAKVRELEDLVNGLPLLPPGSVFSCPALLTTERLVQLTFRRTTHSAPLAVVTETGCVGLSFTAGHRTGPSLQTTFDIDAWLRGHGFPAPRR